MGVIGQIKPQDQMRQPTRGEETDGALEHHSSRIIRRKDGTRKRLGGKPGR